MTFAERPVEPPGSRSVGLLVSAALLLSLAAYLWFATLELRVLWLVLCIVAGVLGVAVLLREWPGSGHEREIELPLVALLVLGILSSGAVMVFGSEPTAWYATSGATRSVTFVVLVAVVANALVGYSSTRARWLGPLLAVGVFVVVAATWLHHNEADIDVEQVLRESSSAFLHGENPYAMTFASRYDQATSDYIYGPGYVVDGRVPYGFPYPPVILLAAVAGHLLGDVRFAGLAALAGAALLLHGRGQSRIRSVLGLCLLTAPGTVSVIGNGWTESITVLLLTAFAAAVLAGRLTLAAALLGALLVSKQYFVVTVPCLWLLRHYATRRRVVVAVVVGAAITLPFALVDPHHFVRSMLGAQLAWPLRPDSLSFAAFLYGDLGLTPIGNIGLTSLGIAFVTAAVLAWRSRPGLHAYVLSTGLSILAMLLTNKIAFLNYYTFVAACFVVAAAVLLTEQRRLVASDGNGRRTRTEDARADGRPSAGRNTSTGT